MLNDIKNTKNILELAEKKPMLEIVRSDGEHGTKTNGVGRKRLQGNIQFNEGFFS